MWRENLLALIEASGLNKQQIADKANLPYDTVKRVVLGHTENPYLDTLERFAVALNCTLADILLGTNVAETTKKLPELQQMIESLANEVSTIKAERDFVLAENTLLKDENKTLQAKVDLLTMQMSYKDEIIALHKIIESRSGN